MPFSSASIPSSSELIIFIDAASFHYRNIHISMFQITFVSHVIVCYIYYKCRAFNLNGKANAQQSQSLGMGEQAKDPHATLTPDLAQLDAVRTVA